MSTPGSNPTIIGQIVRKVKQAAAVAVDPFRKNPLDAKIIRVGESRKKAVAATLPEGALDYEPEHVTVVGGAVLALLYNELWDIQVGVGSVRNELKRDSPDIDMVWWPTAHTEESIATSDSPCIKDMVAIFLSELERLFPGAVIRHTHRPEIGVHNVELEQDHQKVMDLSIHDAGSSQKYTLYAGVVQGTDPMQNDPIYSNRPVVLSNGIRIPNPMEYVTQQIFAYQSFHRTKTQMKSQQRNANQASMEQRMKVSLQRIRYLIKWLMHVQEYGSTKNQNAFVSRLQMDPPHVVLEAIQKWIRMHHLPIDYESILSPFAEEEKSGAIVAAAASQNQTRNQTRNNHTRNNQTRNQARNNQARNNKIQNNTRNNTRNNRAETQEQKSERAYKKRLARMKFEEEEKERKRAEAEKKRVERLEEEKRALEEKNRENRIHQAMQREQRRWLSSVYTPEADEKIKAHSYKLFTQHTRFREELVDAKRPDYTLYYPHLHTAFSTLIREISKVKAIDAIRTDSMPFYREEEKKIMKSVTEHMKYLKDHQEKNGYDTMRMRAIKNLIAILYDLIYAYRNEISQRFNTLLNIHRAGAVYSDEERAEFKAILHYLSESV